MNPPESPMVCPRCGRPRTKDGQPSARRFYACGSYLYEGELLLRDRTDLCEAGEALKHASETLNFILDDDTHAKDEAEKWLRAYAPQYLVERAAVGAAGTSRASVPAKG